MSEKPHELIRLLLGEIEKIAQDPKLSADERARLMRMVKARVESIAREHGVPVHVQIVAPEPIESSARSRRIAQRANPEMSRVAADALSYRSKTTITEYPDGTKQYVKERQIEAFKLVNETFKGLSGVTKAVGNAAAAPFRFVIGVCIRVGKAAVDVVIKGAGSGSRSE